MLTEHLPAKTKAGRWVANDDLVSYFVKFFLCHGYHILHLEPGAHTEWHFNG